MSIRLWNQVKNVYFKDIHSPLKYSILIVIPYAMVMLSSKLTYNKGISNSAWVFGVVILTIVALLMYKTLYLTKGYTIKMNSKSLVIVVIGLIILKSGGWLISWLSHFEKSKNQELLEKKWAENPELLHYYIIDTAIVAPVVEEILFRGILFFGIWKLMGIVSKWKKWNYKEKTNEKIVAVIFVVLSGILFSLVHLTQNIATLLPYLFAGVTFAVIFIMSKNLLIPITIHGLNNFMSFHHITAPDTYKILLMLLILGTVLHCASRNKA